MNLLLPTYWSRLFFVKKNKTALIPSFILLLLLQIRKFDVVFFSCPRIVNKLRAQQLFIIVFNNFFYTQLVFVLDFQKDFYCIHNHIAAFLLFFLQKILIPFLGLFLLFVFFFFRKILIPFMCLCLEPFFVFL